ncbi:DNA helicase [Mycobacterium phage Shrimp]|uniref:DNA helicase n=1 Tax=Mycobacterium phage Shrimp TaxID=1340835 RepID=T2FIZ6_9CAUD|nr:DNA helicase [Mycobacterium phage Shrimp]
MPFGHVQDVEAAVLDFIDHGVSPARIVLFADHPEYPGYLQVEPVDPRARGVFYTTYHDWLSRHLILNGLHLLDQFVELLIEDDFIPLAGPSTARILEDHRRWSEPLAIEGYDLRKFQSFCLNQALERARTGTTNEERFYFLNWSAGSGKSFCAAAGARALLDEGLIDMVLACTLSKLKIGLMRNFTNVAGLDVWINDHSAKATRLRRYQEPRQGLVLNYEKLRVDFDALEEMVRGKRVLFVLDECHKVIAESGANQARKALDKLVRICTATIWPMSATVVGGSPLRFRDVFSLDGHPKSNPLGTKEDFVSRYAEKVTNIPIVTKSGGRFSITRYDWDLDALHEVRHRVGDRTMAVRKTDPGIREQFKGIECIPEWVPMTDELAAIYDLILADAKVARDEGLSRAPHYLAMRVASINPAALQFSTNDIAAQIWAEHPELCQAKFSAKIEMLNDRLESIRESQDKAIVFCHWTSMGILPLQHHLKVPYVLHYGTGQTARESQAAQDRFKADPDLTCFLTSDAGSHGLNMQEARYVINTDPLYSYDDLTQRNARIDRADSHLDGLTAYVMITEESKVENRIWQVCEQRRQLAEAVQGTREELTTAEVTAEESDNIDWLIGLED